MANRTRPPVDWRVILIGVMLFIIVAVVGYYAGRLSSIGLQPIPTPSGVACTLEALMCPDGTAVGRVGPNCEFAPCPTVAVSPVPTNPTYKCPQSEYVNCMPIVDKSRANECSKEFLSWAQKNCPGFKGAAY